MSQSPTWRYPPQSKYSFPFKIALFKSRCNCQDLGRGTWLKGIADTEVSPQLVPGNLLAIGEDYPLWNNGPMT